MIQQFTLQYLTPGQDTFHYVTYVKAYQKKLITVSLKQIEEEYVYISGDANGFIREMSDQNAAEIRELTVDKQLELFGRRFGGEEELYNYYLELKRKTD